MMWTKEQVTDIKIIDLDKNNFSESKKSEYTRSVSSRVHVLGTWFSMVMGSLQGRS
jgi:hypothetical protein